LAFTGISLSGPLDRFFTSVYDYSILRRALALVSMDRTGQAVARNSAELVQ
jgi:hypothetical protein